MLVGEFNEAPAMFKDGRPFVEWLDQWDVSFIAFNDQGYNSFVTESDDLLHWKQPRLTMGFGNSADQVAKPGGPARALSVSRLMVAAGY